MDFNCLTLPLLYHVEGQGRKKEMNKIKRLLNKGISEANLDCISFFLYEAASNVFINGRPKRNTMRLFKMLYKRNIKRIIENISHSEQRYILVDYLIKAAGDTTEYVGIRGDLKEVIEFAFNTIDINKSLAQNIDFKRIEVDEEYAKEVEDIFVLLGDYNHIIRFYEDKDIRDDRAFGMEKIYEYLKIREKFDPEFYKDSIFFDYMLLNVSERYALGNDIEPELFEFLKRGVDAKTKEKDFDVFKDQGISDLLQIINSNQINLSQVKELSKIVSTNLKIGDIDKEKEYEEVQKLISKENLSNDEMQELFAKVQKIKLASNGKIPNDIIDYLISEMLNKKSVLNTNAEQYKDHICRVFESLAANDISDRIGDKQTKYYFYREFVDLIDSVGTQMADMVWLNQDATQETIDTINTIFHENTHVEQDYHFKNIKNCSYYEYMALKENILCKEIPEFQLRNYNRLFVEINAREKANLRMLKYFLSSERLKKRVNDRKIKEIIKKYKNEVSSYIEAYNKREKEDSTEDRDVNNIFGEKLKKEWIAEYPILALEYNEDCSLKTPQEMIEQIEQSDDKKKTLLLVKILKNNEIFKKENLYRDALYLINYSSENKTAQKVVSHIVGSTFLWKIYMQSENFENLSLKEKEKFCEIIKKVEDKLEEEPDSAFSRGILKSQKSKNTAMKMFKTARNYADSRDPINHNSEDENQK